MQANGVVVSWNIIVLIPGGSGCFENLKSISLNDNLIEQVMFLVTATR